MFLVVNQHNEQLQIPQWTAQGTCETPVAVGHTLWVKDIHPSLQVLIAKKRVGVQEVADEDYQAVLRKQAQEIELRNERMLKTKVASGALPATLLVPEAAVEAPRGRRRRNVDTNNE